MPTPTEDSGTRFGAWRRRTARTVALGAVALAGTGAAVALADSTGSSGASTAPTAPTTTSTEASSTAPALTPAPAGFADSLISIYHDQYTATSSLDSVDASLSSSQLMSPASFATEVDSLTPDELSELYAASQKDPSWGAVSGAVGTVETSATAYASSTTVLSDWRRISHNDVLHHRDVRSTATRRAKSNAVGLAARSKPRVTSTTAARARIDALTGADSFPPTAPTTTIPAPPSPFVPSQAVAPADLISCPAGAPGGPTEEPGDDAIYAAQLTSDVAANLAADVPDTIPPFDEPDPAKYVAEAIALTGQVTLDTLNYYQTVAADCDTANRDTTLANLDNTTQQLYTLDSDDIQPTIDAIETSIGTIHQQVQTVQDSVDEQLTIDIEQALSADTSAGSAPPNIEFLLPAANGGNLNSTPVGVQEVVTSAISQAKSAGLVVNAMTDRDLSAADDALSAGQYRTAYDDFQTAYQSLG